MDSVPTPLLLQFLLSPQKLEIARFEIEAGKFIERIVYQKKMVNNFGLPYHYTPEILVQNYAKKSFKNINKKNMFFDKKFQNILHFSAENCLSGNFEVV